MNHFSNLPPGVNESDIPGNRPEDLDAEQEWETAYDNVKDRIENMNTDESLRELLLDEIVDEDTPRLNELERMADLLFEDWMKEHL